MISDKHFLPSIIETTEDGSHTLYVPELNEHYHSTHGAIQESMHIYIGEGLLYTLQRSDRNILPFRATAEPVQNELQFGHDTQQQISPQQPLQQSAKGINILEIGFGTGLNALLTLMETGKKGVDVFYQSIERYPVSGEAVQKLNYPSLLNRFESIAEKANASNQHNYNDAELKNNSLEKLFFQLHTSSWDKAVVITPRFTLLKQQIDFSQPADFVSNRCFDLIYFDAFAPEKQPEMWTEEIFDRLYSFCNRDAILTTYCAKGVVRRMLQRAGFRVERLPGPPGKREILRATKL